MTIHSRLATLERLAGGTHAAQGHDLVCGDGLGGYAGPQPRSARNTATNRPIRDRRRQGWGRHCSRPCTRPADHPPEHGACALSRRGGGDPGPGAPFVPGKEAPEKPGPGTTLRLPAERVRHVLELKPDICSLDMGSLNMGPHVFINTPSHLEAMAVAIRDAGVLPELEVFETGHLLLAKRMIESGHIKPPGMFQICLGIAWGQPATPEAMSYMRNLLPTDSPWFAFGISLHQFPMVAQAVLLGGHVRVGLGDTLYLEKGKPAPSKGT